MTEEYKVTDKTRLRTNLKFLATICALAFSFGIAWAKIAEVEKKQDSYDDTVSKIDRRLSRIEGRLGVESSEDRR